MARQVSIIVGLLALLNAYAAWRVMARIPWAQEHIGLAWLAALGFFLLQMLGPFGDHLWFLQWRRRGLVAAVRVIDWISHLAFGAMSLEMNANPSPDNPKTSHIAALSIMRLLENEASAISI